MNTVPYRLACATIAFLPLTLAGCDGERETFRSEETTFDGNGPTSVSDCIERFSTGRDAWGDDPVRASFVYDISALGQNAAKEFWGGDTSERSSHHVLVSEDDADAARERFLEGRTKRHATSVLRTGEVILFRANYSDASFDSALRKGCDRLTEGAVVSQVTFSRGKR